MVVTARSLRLQAQLEADLKRVTDQQTRDLVAAWVRAWDESAPDLQDAIARLIADTDTGVVAKALVTRNTRLLAALTQIGHQLTSLANQAGIRIVGDISRVVTTAAAAQAGIIAAGLPRDAAITPSLVNAATLDAIVQRTATQITSRTWALAPDAYDAVQRELLRGIVVGTNPRHTADRILARTETEFNGGLARALTIARTETLDAHRDGAAAGMAAHAAVLTGWVWSTHLSERTCPACLAMNGRMFPLEQPGPWGHQNCVLPGAVVSGPRAMASTTRWFEGQVIDIETVDGRSLSVTPNHPILTPHGWVAAGLLREGDDVVRGGTGEGPAGCGRPDDHQVPALIEDVAQTLGGATAVQAVRVPTASEDFHGDGSGSQVHVVRTHGLLRDDIETARPELFGEPEFMVGDVGLQALAGRGSLTALLQGPLAAADSLVSSGGIAAVLLGRPRLHHESVSAGRVALLDPGIAEYPVEIAARDAEGHGKRADGLTGVVSLNYPMPDSEDLARFAGAVTLERVRRISRRWYSGHVYNLQTETGWFLANGILTHNCRCSRTPVTKSWADLGFDLPEPAGKQPTVDGTRGWFDDLPEHDQLAIMGPERLALLRQGHISWDDLATLAQNPGWRPSWQITPVRDLRARALAGA